MAMAAHSEKAVARTATVRVMIMPRSLAQQG
jgi:hypothetical protein